jgi:hypothetical protein
LLQPVSAKAVTSVSSSEAGRRWRRMEVPGSVVRWRRAGPQL